MQEVKHYPHGRSFVAVWHVPARNELFCASFHYKDGQYFTYDETMDDFIPECDHGYTPMFFKRMKARFFVTEVDGEPTWHIEEDWQDSVDIKEAQNGLHCWYTSKPLPLTLWRGLIMMIPISNT